MISHLTHHLIFVTTQHKRTLPAYTTLTFHQHTHPTHTLHAPVHNNDSVYIPNVSTNPQHSIDRGGGVPPPPLFLPHPMQLRDNMSHLAPKLLQLKVCPPTLHYCFFFLEDHIYQHKHFHSQHTHQLVITDTSCYSTDKPAYTSV